MIRRFVLGEGVLSSVGRSGTRGMTVVHGLAVEPPGGAPDVRVTGLPESRVKPLAALLYFNAQVVVEVAEGGESLDVAASSESDPLRAQLATAHAEVAAVTRRLADAGQALTAERRESAFLARRASECLGVMAMLAAWADDARRGELDADEPTASDIPDATLREWAVDVYAALRVAHRAAVDAAPGLPSLDDEPPHRPAADVARVVLADDSVMLVGNHGAAEVVDPSGMTCLRLAAPGATNRAALSSIGRRRVRVVIELLPDGEGGDRTALDPRAVPSPLSPSQEP